MKYKEFISKMNSKGIPVPMIRDPKTGVPGPTSKGGKLTQKV